MRLFYGPVCDEARDPAAETRIVSSQNPDTELEQIQKKVLGECTVEGPQSLADYLRTLVGKEPRPLDIVDHSTPLTHAQALTRSTANGLRLGHFLFTATSLASRRARDVRTLLERLCGADRPINAVRLLGCRTASGDGFAELGRLHDVLKVPVWGTRADVTREHFEPRGFAADGLLRRHDDKDDHLTPQALGSPYPAREVESFLEDCARARETVAGRRWHSIFEVDDLTPQLAIDELVRAIEPAKARLVSGLLTMPLHSTLSIGPDGGPCRVDVLYKYEMLRFDTRATIGEPLVVPISNRRYFQEAFGL